MRAVPAASLFGGGGAGGAGGTGINDGSVQATTETTDAKTVNTTVYGTTSLF